MNDGSRLEAVNGHIRSGHRQRAKLALVSAPTSSKSGLGFENPFDYAIFGDTFDKAALSAVTTTFMVTPFCQYRNPRVTPYSAGLPAYRMTTSDDWTVLVQQYLLKMFLPQTPKDQRPSAARIPAFALTRS